MSKQQVVKKRESTKHYDEVCSKIRRIIGAGVTYMGDLCDALKEDWYPHLTTDMIQHDPDLRSEIRERILDDWSNERNKEGHWQDDYIIRNLRDWVKDPDAIVRGDASGQAKALKKFTKAVDEKRKMMDRLVNELPEPPKERLPTIEESDDEGEEIGEPSLNPLGEDRTIPFLSMQEINSAQYRLWTALTGKENWAHTGDDLQRDFIKPTRELRKRFLAELEQHEQNGIKRRSEFLIALLQDMVESIEVLQR